MAEHLAPPHAATARRIDQAPLTRPHFDAKSALPLRPLEKPPLDLTVFLTEKERSLMEVASHELNHVIVAIQKGYNPKFVSLKRDGNSLGRTVLYGAVNVEDFKPIAAAGKVDTPLGSARGYGSDIHQIRHAHHFHGGKDEHDAYHEAKIIIENNYTIEERKNAAALMAKLELIDGTLFDYIFTIVRCDDEVERNKMLANLVDWNTQKIEEYKQEAVENKRPEPETIIDTYPDDIVEVSRYVNGQMVEKKRFCENCLGSHAANESCNGTHESSENLKKDVVTDHLRPKEALKEKDFTLPKQGRIFPEENKTAQEKN